MKITPLYKNRLVTLPYETVSEKLSTASKEELQVLIAVLAENEFNIGKMCEKLDITENSFRRALASWIDAGAIRFVDDTNKENSIEKSSEAEKTRTRSSAADEKRKDDSSLRAETRRRIMEYRNSMPQYTMVEMSDVIDSREGCRELIDSCQQLLGKMFNQSETAIFVGMLDHLGFTGEYILLLCTHAVQIDKRSVRYIERLALDMFDKNITSYSELESELRHIEEKASLESYVRKLLGMGRRALITKEKEIIGAWNDKYCVSRDMIKEAYDITVTKTKEANINYMNAILENWYAAGYKTVDDVRAAEAARAQKNGNVPQSSSFSTNDFYEAALRRSYSNDSDE